jgi:hypoxanthine-DNA glycosylase
MARLQAFPPIAATAAHTLILGSMPGAASLAAGQYYAHPRNLFWPIVAAVLGIDPDQPYAVRAAQLAAHGFALWDVLAACRRAGSLDAQIERDSMEVNDFAAFLGAHRHIARIFFNGGTAERLFRRHVAPGLDGDRPLALHRLPSTSPANAAIPYAAKLAAWRSIAR